MNETPAEKWGQGWLCGCVTPLVAQAPSAHGRFTLSFPLAILNFFLMIFEQGTSHFHFLLGPAACVGDPGEGTE